MKKWMRFSVVILFGAAIAAALPAQEKSPEIRPPKLEFTTHKLPNGLEVILLEEHEVPVINLQVWYHVGGKDEQPGRTGFAHLFLVSSQPQYLPTHGGVQ